MGTPTSCFTVKTMFFTSRSVFSVIFSTPTHPQFYKNNKKKSFSSFFFRLIICIFVIIYLNRKQFSECQTRNFTCFLQMCRIFYFIYIFFLSGWEKSTLLRNRCRFKFSMNRCKIHICSSTFQICFDILSARFRVDWKFSLCV